MTYEEWKKYKESLEKQYKKGNITKEELETTIRTLEKTNKCLTCRYNNGTPNGECWSCDD